MVKREREWRERQPVRTIKMVAEASVRTQS